MFASDQGRAILSKQAGFQRLLVTCLHRDNTYENLDVIKKELSQKVMELAPVGLDKKHKVCKLQIQVLPDCLHRSHQAWLTNVALY